MSAGMPEENGHTCELASPAHPVFFKPQEGPHGGPSTFTQCFHKVATSPSDALMISPNVLSVVAVDEDPSPSSVVDVEEAA